jgi:hypothetical protein
MRRFLHLTILTALAVCAGLAGPAPAGADDQTDDDGYTFSFEYGKYNLWMPTKNAPDVKYYTDTKGGEYSWSLGGQDLVSLYGTSRLMTDGDWYYTFEGCSELDRDPIKTLDVDGTYWKCQVSDVTLKVDDSEWTYADVWCTRQDWRHLLRFAYIREDDHEWVRKDVKLYLKELTWWN